MAKYEVQFSCGHVGMVPLVGTTATRYRMLVWLQTHGECPECWQKREQKAVVMVYLYGDTVRLAVVASPSVDPELAARGYWFDLETRLWTRELPIGWFPAEYDALRSLGAIPHPCHTETIDQIYAALGHTAGEEG